MSEKSPVKIETGVLRYAVPASNVFVYTKTLFALQNACWGSAPNPFVLHFSMQAVRPGGTLFTRWCSLGR